MKKMNDKVAIVTGGSRGIGRAIVERLAADGFKIALCYVSDTNAANEAVQEVESKGGTAIAVQCDVSNHQDVRRLFNSTIERFGKVDVLVNNAGIILYKELEKTSEEEFDRIFAVNVKGTFLCCKEALTRMNGAGSIINFSTSLTVMMMPTYCAYIATKGAVEQLTRGLTKEVGSRGIRVNMVSPGPTDTELFSEGKTHEQIDRLAQAAALGRLGKPEEIADVVSFLASDDSRWVTGQNIRANGGIA